MSLATSKKIPKFIDLNAKEADSIDFSVYEKDFPNAFRAIKNSGVLPLELIDYLTEEGTFEGVLSKAGFGTKEFSKDGYHSSFGRVLKCSSYQEVLNEYTRKFMFAISPFVKPYSYIEFLHPYTGNYPQG